MADGDVPARFTQIKSVPFKSLAWMEAWLA